MKRRKKKKSSLQRRADMKFRKIMRECRREWGDEEVTSSDEDTPTNQISVDAVDSPISEEDYREMLQEHRRKQIRKKVVRGERGEV